MPAMLGRDPIHLPPLSAADSALFNALALHNADLASLAAATCRTPAFHPPAPPPPRPRPPPPPPLPPPRRPPRLARLRAPPTLARRPRIPPRPPPHPPGLSHPLAGHELPHRRRRDRHQPH